MRYALGALIESFNGGSSDALVANILLGSSIWDVNSDYVILELFATSRQAYKHIVYYNRIDKILNLPMPYVLLVIFGLLTLSKFSWSTRTVKKIQFDNHNSMQNNWKRFWNFEKRYFVFLRPLGLDLCTRCINWKF